MMSIGEQSDRARAFCIAVKEDQKEGKKNRKIMSVDSFKRTLDINNISPIPEMVREVFYEYNVYTKKLRGKDYVGIWWQTKPAHGRGVKKRGNM